MKENNKIKQKAIVSGKADEEVKVEAKAKLEILYLIFFIALSVLFNIDMHKCNFLPHINIGFHSPNILP
jgi:hypothetical protein